jgi:uncharacterized protein YjiS (DUF1127 family)
MVGRPENGPGIRVSPPRAVPLSLVRTSWRETMSTRLQTIIALIRPVPAALGRRAARVGARVLRAIIAARMREVARSLRHRREAHILAGLDDHMLADIGVNRADLRDAFSEPLWRDPTGVLAARAGERRLSARRRSGAPPSERKALTGSTRPALDRSA